MTGFIDSAYLTKKYGGGFKSEILRFFSSTDPVPGYFPDWYSGGWAGLITELEKLGNSVKVETETDILNEPYPSKLRPWQNMDWVYNVRNPMLVSYNFYVYETTRHGSIEQNNTVNEQILTSLGASDTNAYVQGRFLNTLALTWQPNFFNPSLVINGIDLFQRRNTTLFNTKNRAELSLGLITTESRSIYYEIPEGRINTIEAEAAVRQLVTLDNGDIYAKAYPVLLELFIVYE